jgi:hypothetical protein
MRSRTGACSIAVVARARHWGIVSKYVAPASLNCRTNSSLVSVGLTGVTMPPRERTAWKTIAYSGPLGMAMAKTSPLPNPRAASAAATIRTLAANWP